LKLLVNQILAKFYRKYRQYMAEQKITTGLQGLKVCPETGSVRDGGGVDRKSINVYVRDRDRGSKEMSYILVQSSVVEASTASEPSALPALVSAVSSGN